MKEPGPPAWAEQAAALLYRRGADRVWAWGSLGEGRTLDLHSDVDLAVEGMTAPQVEAAKAELANRYPCKVDIVAMEETDAQVRWFVARGRLLRRDATGAMSNGSRPTLRQRRLGAVCAALREAGSRRVLDLGCGNGRLLEALAREEWLEGVLGADMDERALRYAEKRLSAGLSAEQRARVTLVQTLFTWRNPAFANRDAAVAMEVIEHLEPAQLTAFEAVLFDFVRPATVLVTTPNAEYNPQFGLAAGERRHPDHRFEWTRAEFETWGARLAGRYGYRFSSEPVGAESRDHGAATQLGRFARGKAAAS